MVSQRPLELIGRVIKWMSDVRKVGEIRGQVTCRWGWSPASHLCIFFGELLKQTSLSFFIWLMGKVQAFHPYCKNTAIYQDWQQKIKIPVGLSGKNKADSTLLVWFWLLTYKCEFDGGGVLMCRRRRLWCRDVIRMVRWGAVQAG